MGAAVGGSISARTVSRPSSPYMVCEENGARVRDDDDDDDDDDAGDDKRR